MSPLLKKWKSMRGCFGFHYYETTSNVGMFCTSLKPLRLREINELAIWQLAIKNKILRVESHRGWSGLLVCCLPGIPFSWQSLPTGQSNRDYFPLPIGATHPAIQLAFLSPGNQPNWHFELTQLWISDKTGHWRSGCLLLQLLNQRSFFRARGTRMPSNIMF